VRTQRPDLVFLGFFILVLLLAGGLTWINYQIVLNDATGNDFAPLWLGTRLAIFEGQSPYSAETKGKVLSLIYEGRRAFSWENKGWFLYPYFSLLIFSPTAFISDFAVARAVWMTLLVISLLGITFVSLELTRWRPPRVILGGYVVFILGGYYAVRPIYSGNPSILTALFIAMTFLFIQRERDVPAGIMLGLSTFKPQMVILLWWFVLLWAVSRRRLGVVLGMTITPIFLVVGSSILERSWLVQNLTEIIDYEKISGPMTFGALIFEKWPESGEVIGWALTVGFSILLLSEWWRALGKDLRWFLWTAGLTLTITNMIGIPTGTSNHIALIPVLTLVFSIWEQRWGLFGRNLVLVCMLGVLGGLWWLYFETTWFGPGLNQSPIMIIPLPVFVFLMLYWIKYWALGSTQLPVEKLEALKNL
jgi:hypothetical protein